ncbi:MAG: HAD family hydrolase [Clostridia bacterium]|nr:HAD family hydrolase [Clostridia bacterium]
MIRAIIFDFDGTLADTVSALCEGVNLTMKRYGYPTHTNGDILRFINNGARELIRRAMPRHLQGDEDLIGRVLADYNRDYATVYLHTDRAYDGVAELVEQLHGQGYRIGVLSNKQDLFVRELSRQILRPGSYDATQGVVAGKPTKPHPYLAERIAAELGVAPHECVMVGDSDVDVATAQRAGMTHVGVTWGFRDEAFLREHGATRLAHDPAELAEIIKSLNQTV